MIAAYSPGQPVHTIIQFQLFFPSYLVFVAEEQSNDGLRAYIKAATFMHSNFLKATAETIKLN